MTRGIDVQRDIQTEVIGCPSCKEEVPKTLYCLNCGYPLYKWEEEQAEKTSEPSELELTSELDTEVEALSVAQEGVISVESMIDEGQATDVPQVIYEEEPIEVVEAEEVPSYEVEVEEVQVQDTEVEEVEYVVSELEVSPNEVEVFESVEDAVVEAEVVEEVIEEPVVEDAVVEAEVVEEVIEEPVVEDAVVEEPVQESLLELVPDPLVTLVMENLAKNISLKIRLANLLREGQVKEKTFNRLYESYAARGERWMNRRNEMLERSRYDLDAMEQTLADARTNLELLDIRKAIGDAAEEEYQAKAPAFMWDINLFDGELRQRKGEIAYMENMTQVLSEKRIHKLKDMAEGCYEAFDGLVESGKISTETASRVKASLEEDLNCLNIQ